MKRRRGEELDAAIRSAVLDLLVSARACRRHDGGRRGRGGHQQAGALPALARPRRPAARHPAEDGDIGDSTRGHRQLPGGHARRSCAVGRISSPGRAPTFCVPPIAAGAHDPELRAAFQNDVIGWRKQEMAAMLARGIERGDVRADVPVEIARELGQSVLWHRLLITGDPITDDLIVHARRRGARYPFVASARRGAEAPYYEL